MQTAKKLDLSRFKRSTQGLIDFAILIEQADPAARARIIEQAEQQDGEFLTKVMRKVVFFEELSFLEDTVLAEILSKTSPKVLAYALNGMAPEFRTKMLKQIGFREKKQVQEEEERLGQISASLTLGAQKQILKMARTMESQDKFSFEIATCPRFKNKRAKPSSLITPSPTSPAEAPSSEAPTTPHLKLVK